MAVNLTDVLNNEDTVTVEDIVKAIMYTKVLLDGGQLDNRYFTETEINTFLALKASLTGGTFTGQVKGITPVAAEDLTRKDYVDGAIVPLLSIDDFLHIQDQKTSSTDGGSSSAGENIRVLNTVVTNSITGASLASNQITLPIGTYYVEASAPTLKSDRTKLKLINVSDTTTELVGTPQYTINTDGVVAVSEIIGMFTITASKVFSLSHYIETARATNGLGAHANEGNISIYSDIRIWKVG